MGGKTYFSTHAVYKGQSSTGDSQEREDASNLNTAKADHKTASRRLVLHSHAYQTGTCKHEAGAIEIALV